MIQIVRRALANQRGSYLAQNMTGAVVSMMVLGVIGAGLVAVMFAQAGVASKTAVSNQINQSSSSLRSDIQWAGNIASPAATNKSMTIVVPGFGGGEKCKVVDWSIEPNDDRTELKSSTRVYQSSTFQASTPGEPVSAGSTTGVMGCAGAITSEHEEVVIKDVGPDAAFSYVNVGGSTLERKLVEEVEMENGAPKLDDDGKTIPIYQKDAAGEFVLDEEGKKIVNMIDGPEMEVSTPNPAPALNLTAANRAKMDATRIAGVQFTGKVAATSQARATDLDVVQMAENLNRKNLPVSGTQSTNLETVSFSVNSVD